MRLSLVNIICILYSISVLNLGIAEEFVGCLFSKHVCEDSEVCFNDDAFGRCVSSNDDKPSTLYKFDLSPSWLRLLQNEMERLYIDKHKWSHAYTQCVVQTILESSRYNLEYDPKMCNEKLILESIKKREEEMKSKRIAEILSEKEMPEEVSPYDLAYIRFEPSIRQDLEDFADEVFSPNSADYEVAAVPDAKSSTAFDRRPQKKSSDDQISTSTLEKLLALEYLKELKSSDNDDDDDYIKKISNHIEAIKEKQSEKDGDGTYLLSGVAESSMGKVPNEEISTAVQDIDATGEEEEYQIHSDLSSDIQDYIDLYDMLAQSEDGIEPQSINKAIRKKDPKMFSTFQRWDRLDTKKPGPEFPQHGQPREEDIVAAGLIKPNDEESKFVNELVQTVETEETLSHKEHSSSGGSVAKSETTTEEEESESTTNKPYISVRIPVAKKKQVAVNSSSKEKMMEKDSEDVNDRYETVDSSYAYFRVNKKMSDHTEGRKLVKIVEKLLELPEDTFTDIRVDGNQVTFKVNTNPRQLNASQVADNAETLSSDIEKKSGVVLESTGIGDDVKLEVARKNQGRFAFVVTFILVGTAFGVLVAAVIVYVVRRHARTKAKLRTISNPDAEASQDYQDLCRQRMATKTNDKPEPIHVAQAQRISSLSQSEGSAPSPTSRSSTSSWSEEPVTSNMDISTGHMILSYMEDHLKNKDRLDREWEALCAYEAEPCSTDSATASNNIKKNRFPNVIPYDHSRVVLNDLTNIGGSDYINASTITDHDPRNPAYIATQGPLPHTAADFWQMVWEQGSVVIVMLTRLMENGVALCHRYWPEEGSELYHIYEVHLVSEHIWCDDYLVRSFYLKNLKTGETRTVTQFHFLSWPENGVPGSIKALLEFRRKVNKSYRGRSCPIVTHCSDGSGRTGTYCLIDMVLNRMAKGAKEIDIAATLEHIRDQRVAMVKTKAQFEFVLMSIAEEVHAILKAMPQ